MLTTKNKKYLIQKQNVYSNIMVPWANVISDLSCQDLNDPVVWGFCSRVYPDFLILLDLFQFLIVVMGQSSIGQSMKGAAYRHHMCKWLQ